MHNVLNEKLKKEIGFQIIFWVALLVFGLFRNYGEHDQPNFSELLYYDLCHWIFNIIGANFIYFVLIRKYFEQKKYFLFSFYFLVGIYTISVLNRIFIVYLAEPFFVNYPKDSFYNIFTDLKYLFFHYVLSILSSAFIFVSIMFMIRYKNEKQNTLQLQKEKSELELKALKSQLNPHFLFNTLNNIYSLSILNSNATSKSISQLSDILDYILHKGQKEKVSISEEIKIVNDYIALEKLRYDNRLKINNFEEVDFSGFIPPLIYLSLVENAFKHGAEKTSNEIEIRISINVKADFAVFKVENQFFENQTTERSGIGLKNIRKQLDLFYKSRYKLEISQENNWYKVVLITPANEC